MPAFDLDGRCIEYRLLPGDAGKPYLVFLHEGLGSVSLWRDFPDKVARRTGCRALVYSRFGYGQSAGLNGHRAPTFMHDEALAVLPRLLAGLRISRPILIGHSDGASIALIHAAEAAHAIPAAVLMAPHVFVEPVSVENIAKITDTYETTDLRQRLMRHHAHVDDAFLGWSRIWLSPKFRTWSLGAEVQRLTCPTLLIQGDRDEYGTLAQLDAIVEAAPGPVQKLVLVQCGHAPHREQPAAVLDAISGFVEQVLT
jgi:pimeloyl-ACP methyl ester carboxylesterase